MVLVWELFATGTGQDRGRWVGANQKSGRGVRVENWDWQWELLGAI